MPKRDAYDNYGRIVIFRNEDPDNERAPDGKGFFQFDNEAMSAIENGEVTIDTKFQVAVWRNKGGVLSGTIQLPYELRQEEEEEPPRRKAKSRPAPRRTQMLEEDEIPF